nr:hypothetical protein [Chitinophagaceae bacterium]
FIDNVIYSGKFKIEQNEFSFQRIKEVYENLSNGIISIEDNFEAENETLEIYNDKKVKVMSCKLSEFNADCNSASIIKGKCIITDSTIEIKKYCFWSGQCVNCDIGIIYETYKLNPKGVFEQVSKQDKTYIDENDEINFTKNEIMDFKTIISNFSMLTQKEKTKLISSISK